jgi:hypothetical protein
MIETEPKTCFCFDRDKTVSTGDPPGPVPVEYIRYISEDTKHVVWATGNQALKDEVGINGRKELLDSLPNHISVVHKNEGRETMLRFIQQIVDAEEFVVVDDIDLSHVDGVTHYYPKDFVDVYDL